MFPKNFNGFTADIVLNAKYIYIDILNLLMKAVVFH